MGNEDEDDDLDPTEAARGRIKIIIGTRALIPKGELPGWHRLEAFTYPFFIAAGSIPFFVFMALARYRPWELGKTGSKPSSPT